MTDDRPRPPPVEPISDAAWGRIERELWTRLDGEHPAPSGHPARSWRWLAIPAIAMAALIAIVVAMRGGSTTTATDEEPSRVVAGAAPSTISFGDAHITLDPEAAVVMRRERGAPSVLLEHGAAWFAVAPRGDRPAFVVRAGDATVRVVGTRFRVGRSEERITVEVDHGIVDVLFRGTTTRVGAAQRWASDRPDQVAIAASSTPRAVTTPASGSGSTVRPADSRTTAPMSETENSANGTTGDTTTGSTTTGSTTTGSTTTGKTTTGSTTTSKTTTGSTTTGSTTTGSTTTGSTTTGSTTTAAGTRTAAGKTTTETDKMAVDRAAFDRLAAIEAKDPEAALEGYLTLSRGSNRWAAVALFAAGRLAADRHDARAQTFLLIYLRRFPTGANAADARTLLDRLHGVPQ